MKPEAKQHNLQSQAATFASEAPWLKEADMIRRWTIQSQALRMSSLRSQVFAYATHSRIS